MTSSTILLVEDNSVMHIWKVFALYLMSFYMLQGKPVVLKYVKFQNVRRYHKPTFVDLLLYFSLCM